MDNLPRENPPDNSSSPDTGEIYSADNQSSYQEVVQTDLNTAQGSFPQGQPSEPVQPQETMGEQNISPPSDLPPIDTAPPFTEENKLKKYFILIIGFFLLVFFIFIIFSFIKKIFIKPAAKPPENITLSYWGLWEEKEIIQPIIEEYRRSHPTININFVKQDQKQYRERLQAAIERGEGPDIFRFHNTWLPMLITVLSTVPKNIYSDSDFEKTFYPVVSADLKAAGNYYGIPLMIDGLLLYYNEDIFKSANVSVPKNWEDVQKILSKITVKDKDRIVTSPIALGTADNIEHFSDILALMMLQNGVQPNKSLFSCADSSKTDCASEALAYYHKFAEPPDNVWDDTLENSINAFAFGHVAMIFAPSWQTHTIKQINPNLNFKIAQVPQLPCDPEPCTPVHWASYWVEGVSAKSKNIQAAWEFLKYLSQEDTMQKLYTEQSKYRLFGEPYSRVELGKMITDNPYLSPLIASAPYMKSFYSASRTFDGETGINSSLNKYLQDAINSLSKGTSPETALKTADSGFKQIFSRFNLSTASP